MIQLVKVLPVVRQVKPYVVIHISFLMLLYQVTVFLLLVVHGMVHFVFGIYQLAQVHDNLLVIKKMF